MISLLHSDSRDAEGAIPTLGVCIVTYNSESDIADCLQAVLAQTYPIARIVVVDNASADGTLNALAPYADSITLIASSTNTGFAGGQNIAIKQAGTDYVLVLNPDVRLQPHYASRIIEAMEADSGIGSGCGLLVRADDNAVVDSTGLAMSRTRQATDRGAGEAVNRWQTQDEVFGVSGAAALYASRMIADISVDGQFFDETFFAYKEDVDVAWRARALGWRAVYIPTAMAVHGRGWKQGGRRAISIWVRQHSYQNQWFLLFKNEQMSWHSFYAWPLIAAKELAKLGYIILREPGLLGCWPQIVRVLPEMLRKRRIINKKRSKG
ncbi:glycosyl transferase family 2 [Paenibacillus curdlanolyticus YK9]|uniref:Glycosyl transferase family 2 n=1 Tax=Paenibacillus curdlanolyticus YK9 TaxID=717606 RepID=E0IEP4_9BACL|nr:glycosyltransferase family 2 protein [Paenibacillus curdlanolyticus]EFM09132.1 glycosyl transferase family 2 [Paenibacillus curdlanolyticus YK9]